MSIASSANMRILWVAPELADPLGMFQIGHHRT
jgi:hypothetical protein